jgi:pyruvate/2-oxoglutarate dehydrogenase complex dihydrolipoamide acyltransferase (E2) component
MKASREKLYKQIASFEVVPYPKVRQAMGLTTRSAARTRIIHGLVEVDVTCAREFIREHKARAGQSLSFTAFIIACYARAIDENKVLQACRLGRNRIAIFDDVDVAVSVEREMEGQKQPIVYILRAANRKSLLEIHREIRQAQSKPPEQYWEGFNFFAALPMVVFKGIWPFFWWLMRRNPHLQKKYGGTVGITAVGMFGGGAGWGIPVAYHTQLTLGGIATRPAFVDGQVAPREYLCLTLSFDHDLVDGAPAARFSARLKELIESGYELNAL